jgi:transketolase
MVFNPANLRKTVLDMAFAGSTVHIGCAFSIIEILAVLYRNHLRFPNNDPDNPNRDYLILSKGHGVMAQYACFKELSWLTESDIQNYFSNGSKLKGLSDAHVPGLEVTSGSLGHGLSVGVGIALGCKLKNSKQKIFAIIGDGEMNEGSIWEALLFAAHFELSNLIVIVDKNNFQAMGRTDEVLSLGDLSKKLEAFDFETREVNGHDEKLLDSTIRELINSTSSKPKAIVANTIKGKGVSFMENNNLWHYTRLTESTYKLALQELTEKITN